MTAAETEECRDALANDWGAVTAGLRGVTAYLRGGEVIDRNRQGGRERYLAVHGGDATVLVWAEGDGWVVSPDADTAHKCGNVADVVAVVQDALQVFP